MLPGKMFVGREITRESERQIKIERQTEGHTGDMRTCSADR